MADKPRDPRLPKEPSLLSHEPPEEPAEPNRVLMILKCGCTLPQPNPNASVAYCSRHKTLVNVATYTYLENANVAA